MPAFPRRSLLTALIAVLLSLAPAAAHAAPVVNGDFETADLSGWTVDSTSSSGTGSWFNYSGTVAPLSGAALSSTIPAPPQGTRAAIADQVSLGRRILYQDVALAPNQGHTLTASVYYVAQQAAVTDSGTLDYTSAGTVETYRVDVMKPAAALDSVAAADVLVSVFATHAGDPQRREPAPVTADLTPFAGQTVRLRFAEADNAGVLNTGVDDVKISDDTAAPVPTLDSADRSTRESRPAFSGTAGTAAFDDGHVHLLLKRGTQVIADADVPVVAGAWSFAPGADLGDGAYAVTVTQSDGAGNVGTATGTTTVDTTAPDLSADVLAAPGTAALDGRAGQATGDASQIVARLAGPTAAAQRTLVVNGDGTFTTRYEALADGDYTLTLTQADAVGNVRTLERAFTVTTPPAVTTPPIVTAPTLTFGLEGRRDQLLLGKRFVSVHVGCGAVACRVVITGRALIRGKLAFKFKPMIVRVSAATKRVVHVTTTAAQRKRVRHALSPNSTKASVQFTAVATGANGLTDRGSFSVVLRRLKAPVAVK